MQIVLITGISGSGKSVALHALEDTGYFCVDNLPPSLLRQLVATNEMAHADKLAIATDARSAGSLSGWASDIEQLKKDGHDVRIIFLTASTESLITRFSETRRSHPLSHKYMKDNDPTSRLTLEDCILKEREMLSVIEGIEHVIDTSHLTAHQLRHWIQDFVSTQAAPLMLLFESFAFKYGVPLDADLVFDVRMLPNPYYDPKLRPLTGKDQPVIDFLSQQPEADDLFNDISHFVEKWLPSYKRNNRSYLTVAIGCTGGQHRSVYLAERLTHYFANKEQVLLRHRQLR